MFAIREYHFQNRIEFMNVDDTMSTFNFVDCNLNSQYRCISVLIYIYEICFIPRTNLFELKLLFIHHFKWSYVVFRSTVNELVKSSEMKFEE